MALIRTWRGKLSDCELVVLSACDTQRGIKQGDSVMALTWGFFYAGAPTVVASLWKVDDRATSLLMGRFYENLLGELEKPRTVAGRTFPAGKPMAKGAALREAKLWLRGLTDLEALALLKEQAPQGGERGAGRRRPEQGTSNVYPFESPYYWAAFVLNGDPG